MEDPLEVEGDLRTNPIFTYKGMNIESVTDYFGCDECDASSNGDDADDDDYVDDEA